MLQGPRRSPIEGSFYLFPIHLPSFYLILSTLQLVMTHSTSDLSEPNSGLPNLSWLCSNLPLFHICSTLSFPHLYIPPDSRSLLPHDLMFRLNLSLVSFVFIHMSYPLVRYTDPNLIEILLHSIKDI